MENGILGAIDFLKRELKVKHYRMLAFPGILVPLSSFFATNKKDGQSYTSLQNDKIKKWFSRSLFSRRFSAGVNERQALDIIQMQHLKVDENYNFTFPPQEIKFDFSKSSFSSGNANSKTLISMLNQKSPHSFISGAKIDLDLVLKKGSKHEYHHIFPKKFLEKQDKTRREINTLSNICFLTRSDNNKISDKSPNQYIKLIKDDKRESYLKSAVVPVDFHKMTYDEFIEKRTSLLEEFANHLMN